MKVSIVVPMFNEVESVPRLRREMLPVVRKLAKRMDVEVIFVDDGSRDGTDRALRHAFSGRGSERLQFTTIHHVRNRGLGSALRTGFLAAGGDVVVTTDSDGTYAYSEIPALLDRMQPGVDIVTASPYHPDGGIVGVPASRLLLSRGCSLIYRLLVDRRVWTYTSMFRAYRRAVVKYVAFGDDGHQAVAEMLVRGLLLGCKVAEYPAVLKRRAYGVSKARIVATVRAHLRFQLQILSYRVSLKDPVWMTLRDRVTS
jgi:dolichol-phosphate mannosyltransferase